MSEKPFNKTEKKLLNKPVSHVIQRLQKKVNEYVRKRDRDRFCISCGTSSISDAGHYIAVGRCEKLRFDLDNIHGQCRQCNYFGGGEIVDYRRNLILKIGEERVERLEEKYQILKRDTSKWDKVGLILMLREINQKLKEV